MGAIFGALCVFWSSSGFADPLPPNQYSPQPSNEHGPVYCESFLPIGHIPDTDRTTWLSVHILADGEIRDATVAHSSGRFDLDDAAVACASHEHSLPAIINGSPAEIVWGAKVEWRPTGHVYGIFGRAPGYPATCLGFYPGAARRNHESGAALVSFLIETDGTVRQPAITKSSGLEDLDDAALACVLSWRFVPATVNGSPVELGWRANVIWTYRE